MVNVPNGFFRSGETAHRKVADGKVKTVVKWPELKGICTLIAVSPKVNSGKNFLEFTLKHERFQTNTVGVRIPSATEKDGAISAAMNNIYNTLFTSLGQSPDSMGLEDAFMTLTMKLEEAPILCSYELREYTTLSKTNGKTYINQGLESLCTIEADSEGASELEEDGDVPY